MALPRAHQASFTPGEIEFVAGDENIMIIPSTKMPKLRFIQGNYGPFIPPLQTEVPVWLALLMKKNNKCSIVCPDWLTVGTYRALILQSLKEKHKREEDNSEFSDLPFHYMELSQMILETAEEDVPNAEQIRTILKDIRETRQAKSRAGLTGLDDKWLLMSNVSFMELNEIRPFFSRAFDEMRKLKQEEEAAKREY